MDHTPDSAAQLAAQQSLADTVLATLSSLTCKQLRQIELEAEAQRLSRVPSIKVPPHVAP